MVHVYMIHDKLIVRNAKFHQMTGKMINYLSNVKKPFYIYLVCHVQVNITIYFYRMLDISQLARQKLIDHIIKVIKAFENNKFLSMFG